MKRNQNVLGLLGLGSLVASTLAFTHTPSETPDGSVAVFDDDPDPRLLGLQAAPESGQVATGSDIFAIAGRDELFAEGLALFDRDFRFAEGLGAPEMNADSCRACHQDPTIGGAGGLELNVTRHGDDNGGAGPFVDPPGGQGLSKLYPPQVEGREEYDDLVDYVFEQRQTPSILGAGLVDQIPASVILANEDPRDANGDGIRGVARVLTVDGQLEVGRFGWKAQIPRLRDFSKDAMGGELGITTPDDGRGFAMLADSDGVGDPELSESQVDALTHFMSRLPRPKRVNPNDAQVLLGESLFEFVGCATCHVPALEGPNGPVPLYSDLLLHDVMPDDYRGMWEPGAGPGLFKTPPLWGVRDTAPYLHDGRAATLVEAVLAHEGEAAGVVQATVALTGPQQEALFAFLQSL